LASTASRRAEPASREAAPEPVIFAAAEIVAIAWECVSALLFATAVSPAVVSRPGPVIVFVGGLGVTAFAAPRLFRRGPSGRLLLDSLRGAAWALALSPVVELTGPRALLGAGVFGMMTNAVRRTAYRRAQDRRRPPTIDELRESLNERLAESTTVVGVVAGHVLMLFVVAFLRTTNEQIQSAWWQVLPWLTLGGTLLFTLMLPRFTAPVRRALEPDGAVDAGTYGLALRRANQLPGRLGVVNFAVWLACASLGAFGFRHLFGWTTADAAMVVLIGLVIAWGISFYQRAWHTSILAPIVDRLRRSSPASFAGSRIGSVGRRMLVDFGLPLVFCCTLSLVSSLGLYRALAGPLGTNPYEVIAVAGAFVVLAAAAVGVIARSASALSSPLSLLAGAANRIARGDLASAVPRVAGPDEMVLLGDSIERMRRALARTIGELSAERAGLEEKVAARTLDLRQALANLKEAQAALLHGEKMASLGHLVAGVAHEINNPLNAIAGSVDSLHQRAAEARRVFSAYLEAERALPDQERALLERLRSEVDLEGTLADLEDMQGVIQRSTGRAVRIVRDLLHFSRASRDRVPTDLHTGLDEALSLLSSPLRNDGIAVDRVYGALPEVLVRADEVNQIFLNLLTNALSAVAGRPAPRIVVRTGVVRGMAEIAIEDNGRGVPEELRTRIFDPFFTTKRAGEGTGLGLSISSQIAARHGGSLSVEAADGGGARFVLRLPLEPPDREPPGDAPRRTST
jgi:two-component system, NtrC family, sensor kinase